MRVFGYSFWSTKTHWKEFYEYERDLESLH